ncbi:MAG: YchE family NAAT transporter [Aeromonadaceae bacterium]|mgnify:FL=1
MEHFELSLYLKFFIGLVAIINPLGLLPVFVSLTSHQTPQERLKTNTTANLAVMIILWVSMFFGQVILDVFGISIASFRIAGGSLITLIAWSMLQGKLGEVRHNKEEKGESVAKESIAVVPLALPLMAGPGAISSTIVYASQFNSPSQLLALSLVVVAFSLFSWLVFRAAPLLFRLMGKTGINVVTRIMGLIMMSLGIEIMVAGIKHMFPGLM